jgi:hypothetical protein
MNMGVINLIVCAHGARDAAHRLTVPVSGGRRRARIRSGGARDELRHQCRGPACGGAAESGDGLGILPGGIQTRCAPPQISLQPAAEHPAAAWC